MQTDDVIEETTVTTTRRKRKPPTRETRAAIPTHVCLLIDESGSMRGIREKTIDSVNDYLMTLKKAKGEFYVTLATFNSTGTRVRYADIALEATALLTSIDYVPNYDTPLYDAMGDTLHTMERSIRRNGAAVVFVLITDGQENASRRFTPQMIYAMRAEKEAAGWTFVYLGADMTELQAQRQSQFMGFATANTMTFDKADTGEMYKGLAESTASYSMGDAKMRAASAQNFAGTVGSATLRKTVKR